MDSSPVKHHALTPQPQAQTQRDHSPSHKLAVHRVLQHTRSAWRLDALALHRAAQHARAPVIGEAVANALFAVIRGLRALRTRIAQRAAVESRGKPSCHPRPAASFIDHGARARKSLTPSHGSPAPTAGWAKRLPKRCWRRAQSLCRGVRT